MAIDREAVKLHIRGLLKALGDDPDREGLKDTPDRVARMYEEVFEGMNYTNHEIAQMFDKTFEEDLTFSKTNSDFVIVKDINIFSYCEHHMALMYDMKVPGLRTWFPNVCSFRNGSELTLRRSSRKWPGRRMWRF